MVDGIVLNCVITHAVVGVIVTVAIVVVVVIISGLIVVGSIVDVCGGVGVVLSNRAVDAVDGTCVGVGMAVDGCCCRECC